MKTPEITDPESTTTKPSESEVVSCDELLSANLTEKEIDIFNGHEESNLEMAKLMYAAAPLCHMRKMFADESDCDDMGGMDRWYECSVCGHTKSR